MSPRDVSSPAARLEAARLAVGIRRRTLRKPQALNGALRQFASVTSLSGEGGKSSIRSADILSHLITCAFGGFAGSGAGIAITFRRGANLTIAIADTEHRHKPFRNRAKSRAPGWNK